MSAHLSSEQISRLVAGDRTPDEDQHIRTCAECAAEAARLGALLAEFRASVVAWSALQKGAETPGRWKAPERRSRLTRGTLRWTLAAAALTIAVAMPICKNANDRRRAVEAARADARLWEEINAQVSRPFPTPLEPLMSLIAWEPASNAKTTVEQGEIR